MLLSFLGRALKSIWQAITAARRIAANLIFLAIVALVVAALLASGDKSIPQGVALIFSPVGRIVEQSSEPLLAERFYGSVTREETELRDLVEVLDAARNDAAIRYLVLDPSRISGAGPGQLAEIGAALDRFKQSGKTVYVYGESFNQAQFFLAAHADRLYLHPMGQVWLSGYGVFRRYFKDALDKLLVQLYVFRVGTYKSALEPFMRNDMSEDDREANLAWLTILWSAFTEEVGRLRRIPAEVLDDYINNLHVRLAEENGDAGQLALRMGLVDELKTWDEFNEELISLVGRDDEKRVFRQIALNDYAEIVLPKTRRLHKERKRVGIIAAEGIIMNGEQPAGRIGSDSLARLFRQARQDDRVKAVVLRINSGGGSATASEIIRRELELTVQAGKPVVVSMSSVAASGAYWLSVAADEIWAYPVSITGSIGIFAALATVDKSLNAVGVYTDGVGTTRMAGAFDPTRPLNPRLAEVLQESIEHGYTQFVDQVAKGRQLDPDAVEKAAQGRVWAGVTAVDLGLVDKLGNLQDAVRSAASMADLATYDTVYITPPLSAREELLKRLNRYLYSFFSLNFRGARDASMLRKAAEWLGDPQLEAVLQVNDPRNMNAVCLPCLAIAR